MIVIERIFFLIALYIILSKFTEVSVLLMPQDNAVTDLFFPAYALLVYYICFYALLTAFSIIKVVINYFRG